MTNIRRDKGYGFVAQGMLYLVRCFDCGKENYHGCISRGYCRWCGATPSPLKEIKKTLTGENK